jgi:hypothetical protein
MNFTSSTTPETKTDNETVQVACRFRPINNTEKEMNKTSSNSFNCCDFNNRSVQINDSNKNS